MDFNPVALNLSQILVHENRIIIPDFQRSFSWESKQSTTLLDDLLLNLKIEENSISEDQYYLGTMIFVNEGKVGSRDQLSCIDGQQRLTTLTILLSALGDTFNSKGLTQQAEKIYDYIIPYDNDGKSVKIIENEANYPYFYDFIQSRQKNDQSKPNSPQEKLILKTYQEFKKQLSMNSFNRKLKERIRDIEYIDILKALREQILKTTIIRILSSDRCSANKIFESINSRGKPLSSIDLIKSFILGAINDQTNHERAYTYWKKIIQILSDSGNLIPDETFFLHYWSSKYKKEISSKLYSAFVSVYGKSESGSLLEFLQQTEIEAYKYRLIVKPDLVRDFEGRKQKRWYIQSMQALNEVFNISQGRIAILAILDLYYKDESHSFLSSKNLKIVIHFIENFHFVFNGLMSYRASKVEPLYSKFAIALRKSRDQTEALKIIKEELCIPLRALLPDKAVFTENFVLKLTYSNKGTNTVQQNMLTRYALYRLWSFINNDEIFPSDGSIEHILPESSGDEEFLNVGNLLVLEERLNGEGREKPYIEKLDMYKQSRYKDVIDFCDTYKNFTNIDIKDRARKMAEIYYEKLKSEMNKI